MTSTPNPTDPALLTDLLTVTQAEIESREVTGQKISNFQASPDEVLDWWSTQDPLSESLIVWLTMDSLEGFAKDSFCERVRTNSRQMELGAITIVLDVVDPEILTTEQQYLDLANSNSTGLSAESNAHLFETAVEAIAERDSYTYDEFARLLVAAEMVLKSSVYSENVWEGHEEEMLAHNRISVELSGKIIDKVTQLIRYEETDADRDRGYVWADAIRMLGIRASVLMTSISANMSTTLSGANEQFKQAAKQYIGELVGELQALFDNPKSTMWQRTRTELIKGQLHEVLWFLDFHMLKYMHPEIYGGINCVPSSSNNDQPTIGQPDHNRAWDMYVSSSGNIPDSNDTTLRRHHEELVQLKSSPQKNKPGRNKIYHPRISVIEEQNFIDLDPRRLRKKLNIYADIIKKGFNGTEAEKLSALVLPSVKHYLEEYVHHASTADNEQALGAVSAMRAALH